VYQTVNGHSPEEKARYADERALKRDLQKENYSFT
jgi:hypothetical protein